MHLLFVCTGNICRSPTADQAHHEAGTAIAQALLPLLDAIRASTPGR